MATMFALMLVAIGGNYLFRNKQPDSNISYYHYNVGQNKLEVYDSLNHLLWSAPTPLAEDAAITEKELRRTYTIIMDLAGRGENSLVTTLPLGKMKHSSEVQVYKKDGKLVEHRSFENTKFSFLRTQYDGPFIPSDLVLFGSTGTAHTVIVSASTGRSPNIAARLDSSLGVLGRFWHYGSLSPYRVDSVAGVGSALVLIGQNDVSDATDRTFCVMIIVDPGKIVNDQESSATKGFGLASSDAELYYVRFPRTDMEMVSNQFVIPQRVDDLGASALSVKLQTRVNQLSGPNQSGFDYFFSKKDLRVIDVRFNTPTERTHRILKRQGKIHSQFDRSYLENLKGRVSYWDGAKWIPVPTRIPH